MKIIFLLAIPTLLLTSCMPAADQKSVLAFTATTPSQSSGGASRDVASNAPAADLQIDQLQARMGDRYYVSAVLAEVFGKNAAGQIYNVKTKMDVFGGGCDVADYSPNTSNTCANDDCNQIKCSGTFVNDNQIGSSSVIRQGILTKTCEDIVGSNNDVLYAVRNLYNNQALLVNSYADMVPNDTLIKKAYGQFYRDQVPTDEILTGLKAVAAAEPGNNFEKWRYILLTICTTPQWQIP